MKLLFDQNISFRIVRQLAKTFPNSAQVRELGLEDSTDYEIWMFAKQHDYTIVTFDADFSDIANIQGFPPKIVWLRTGNMTTTAIIEILKKYCDMIQVFVDTEEYKEIACLEIE